MPNAVRGVEMGKQAVWNRNLEKFTDIQGTLERPEEVLINGFLKPDIHYSIAVHLSA
jgi:hypothetical protein